MARILETVTPDELGFSGNSLKQPGIYHLMVEDIRDGYMCTMGEPTLIKNGGFGVRAKVLHGPHADNTINFVLNDPNISHKDKGVFARKKQSAFLVAANVLNVENLTGEAVSYDEQVARHQQFIAEFELGKPGDDGKQYLDIAWANIYHVDDPRAAKVEKSANYLALIPPELRHQESYFAPLLARSPKATTSAPPAQELDLGGI